jgi:hypothetical protein
VLKNLPCWAQPTIGSMAPVHTAARVASAEIISNIYIYIYYNCNLTRWVTSNPFNKTCFILICLNYTTIFYWPLHSNLLAKQDLIQYCTFKYSKSSFSFVSTHWAPSLCQDLGMNCLSWWQLFFLVEVLLSVPENQRNKCSQRRQRE